MQDLHGYGQLLIPGQKPEPERVMTVDAMKASEQDSPLRPGIHLRISDVVIAGNFELDVLLTATQSGNLGCQLCYLAAEAQASTAS